MIKSDFAPSRPSLDEVTGEPSEATAWGSSRWNTLAECPRKYALQHIEHVFPTRPSDALDIGTMYHRARAIYFRYCVENRKVPIGKRARVAAEAARLAREKLLCYRDSFLSANSPSGVEVVDAALGYWQGYLARYGEDYGFRIGKVLMVEELIEARLPGPEWRGQPLTGDGLGSMVSARLDTAALLRGGRGWVLEAKTSAMRTRDVLEGFSQDLQLMRQAWLWQIGHEQGRLPPLGGIIVDICFKLKQPEYEQIEHVFNERDIARFLHTMRWYDFLRYSAAMHGYPHDFTRCRSQFGLCSMFDYCLNHGQSAMGYRHEK